eukprot:GFUD01026801.1.p1 GENE.GFUD01026801.1~~GFUD01026801.1.p1  ORF type:complete len:923 (-),score=169.35 GFUD01026801.1:112-2880(-)
MISRWTEVVLILFLCLQLTTQEDDSLCKAEDKPIKFYRISQPNGDQRPRVTLVGLFPLHKGTNCNEIVSVKNYNGFQRMEAFVLALDKVNGPVTEAFGPVSEVFIEAILYDTCSDSLAEYPIRALKNAIKMIEEENKLAKNKPNMIIGVVGAAYSSVTIPFAKATLALKLPLVSYAATNRDLSKFKMFARTVWSDDILAKTITDIIYNFHLTSLKTLGTSGSSNSKTLADKILEVKDESIKKKSPDHQTHDHANFSLCDVVEFPKKRDAPRFEEVSQHILDSLVDAYVVALKADTKPLFLDMLMKLQDRNQTKLNPRGPLQLISTDTWDISDDLSKYTEIADLLKNSITIVEDSADESKIETRNHLQKIVNDLFNDLSKDPKNPWLKEFWRAVSNCSEISENCGMRNLTNFKIDSKVENVMNTAVLYAKTFGKYMKDKCSNKGNACIYESFDGREYFDNFILNTKDIKSLFGKNKISIDCHGDSLPMYAIYQLQTQKLVYKKIGTWNYNKNNIGTLTMNNNTQPLTALKNSQGPEGTKCKPKCKDGEKEVFRQRSGSGDLVDDCCHTCHTLEENEVFEKGKNIECGSGLWPNKDQTECDLIWADKSKIPNYDGSSPPVITVDLLCALFMIIIAAYAGFLFINKDHVAVTRTGLHYFPFIFGGAFLCQLSGIVFLHSSFNGVTCTFIQFLTGLSPTIMFTAIVVKTRKVYRIFIHTFQENRNSTVDVGNLDMCPPFLEQKLEKLMAPKTRQIVTIFALIAVQFFIISIWTIIHYRHHEAYVTDIYPNNRHIQICNIGLTEFFGVQGYNLFLVFMCTVYGYMTRHVRSDFNETKYISFAMFTVCLIWTSGLFIIAAVMNTGKYNFHSELYEPELHVSVFSFMLALSGMAVIAIMFTNKVYLILKKEDKEAVRESKQLNDVGGGQ